MNSTDGIRATGIIGGMFGLEEAKRIDKCYPPFLNEHAKLFANARSGLAYVIKQLSPSVVWLPSYLCVSVLEAVNKCMTEVKFYEVSYNLEIRALEWTGQVRKGDVVVFIDYFGCPYDVSLANRIKERGAWILEDACQALLSENNGHASDFILFSPRKFLAVPDGGIIGINCDVGMVDERLECAPVDWWLKAFNATVLRREFDLNGGDRRWFDLFQETDTNGPIGDYAISELSKVLLMNSFDYPTIAERRIENYQVLLERLKDIALIADISSKIVPLGFPIHLEMRDKLRQTLFEHEIYPPVHWHINGLVPIKYSDSHRLASKIMTLPCDQRYDSEDMERIADIVLQELRK